MLYADDCTISYSHKYPDEITGQLGKVFGSCSSWLVDDKLSLHPEKPEYILFGSKRNLREVKRFQISCNGQFIKSTDHVKYLGLTIGNNLSGVFV